MSFLAHANRHLTNIAKYKDLNAVVSLADRSSILSAASKADKNAPTNPRNPHGRVVLVKDNICTTELPTTASSGILKKFESPYDATVVKQLKGAGALVAGKTNMDEFGMGSHSINSYHGATKMKRGEGEEERGAGGSSGGSAVAVATDMCWAALGTDTGGSVRLPAAYTGVVGFKPSYGLLSRWGVIAYANSLDTVGVLGGDVDSVEGVFDTLNHHDPLDPTSLSPTTRARLSSPTSSSALRIGIPVDYNISTLSSSVLKTWQHILRTLHNQGHTLHPVRLPYTRHALSAYYVLAPAEASSNLAKYDGVRYGSRAEGIDGTPESVLFAKTRGQGFGEEVRRRILLGAFSLSAEAINNYFIQAQRVRRLVQLDFDQAFRVVNPLLSSEAVEENAEGVDVLLCPTAPTVAPSLKDVQCQDPLKAYMNDVFTVPASLAGLPAISVPVGVAKVEDARETVGMQIIGQYGSDKLVLNVARELLRVVEK